MLLLRDAKGRADSTRLVDQHFRMVREVYSGNLDLAAVHAEKLINTLSAAARSAYYGDLLDDWRDTTVVERARLVPPAEFLANTLASLPVLDRDVLRKQATDFFTLPMHRFHRYFESSGTTGDPVAAPKALDDLVVNTVNIGEMWHRLLRHDDIAIVLINGPFAPAGFQFEMVLGYLGVETTRLWVDNVTGDYTRILRIIRELPVNIYVGTASRLLEMVQFACRNGLDVPRFDHLLLMAEQTGPAFLRHLERITGGRAHVATFGSSETGTTAATCEHDRLHLQLQSYLLEVADEHGCRLIDGRADRGQLVVTTLDLPGRPLLRYQTGDLIEVTGQPCPCGIPLPVINTLGRAQDAIPLRTGGALRQDDIEAALWPAEHTGPVPLNYMLVLRQPDVICLVTTDRPVEQGALAATERRLATVFAGHRVALRVVDELPQLASLGSYLGWKMSRLLDLDRPRALDQLPGPLHSIITNTLATLADATGLTITG